MPSRSRRTCCPTRPCTRYGWIHQLILMGIVLAVLVVLLKHGPEVRLGQLFEIALLC